MVRLVRVLLAVAMAIALLLLTAIDRSIQLAHHDRL